MILRILFSFDLRNSSFLLLLYSLPKLDFLICDLGVGIGRAPRPLNLTLDPFPWIDLAIPVRQPPAACGTSRAQERHSQRQLSLCSPTLLRYSGLFSCPRACRLLWTVVACGRCEHASDRNCLFPKVFSGRTSIRRQQSFTLPARTASTSLATRLAIL